MIFLVSLQVLFILLFLHFVNVFVLFHVLITCFNFFHSFQMMALALETVAPFNSSFISRISLQNKLYVVFFAGTSCLGVFKHFTLEFFNTVIAFCIKLSLSSSTPQINSQSVLSKAVFINKNLARISKSGHKFFRNPQGS